MASACLPFLYDAVEIDGEAYWDGGYSGNPSLYPLVDDHGCRDLVVVQINPLVRRQLPGTAREIVNRINEITFNSSLVKELRSIQLLHRLIDAEGLELERYRAMRLHLIHAEKEVEQLSASSKLNSEWSPADVPGLPRTQPADPRPGVLAALVALVSVDTPLLASYTQVFMGAARRFHRRYFPLFLLGAVFGKLMEDSGSAEVLAGAIVERLGDARAILAVVLSCAVMTYGGVSLFVVAFAVYPIAAALFRQADLPKRLIPGTIALGAFTFTMTALPGTPAIQNAIPMPYFGTSPSPHRGSASSPAWSCWAGTGLAERRARQARAGRRRLRRAQDERVAAIGPPARTRFGRRLRPGRGDAAAAFATCRHLPWRCCPSCW
jgi:hypothetical protein